MGFWDYFTRTFDEQESFSQQPSFQSSMKSSRVVCRTDQDGKMKCTKYTTTKGNDGNNSWTEENQEELPHNEGFQREDEFFKEMDDMMSRFMGSLANIDREGGGIPSFFRIFPFGDEVRRENQHFEQFRERQGPYGYGERQQGFENPRFGQGNKDSNIYDV